MGKAPSRYKSESSSLPDSDASLAERIGELERLPPGWDGAAAVRIDPRIVATAREFALQVEGTLPSEPQVVPMTGGRLQLEWHDGPRSLEIEFESPTSVHYLKWDSAANVEEEDVIPSTDRDALERLLRWFFSDDERLVEQYRTVEVGPE